MQRGSGYVSGNTLTIEGSHTWSKRRSGPNYVRRKRYCTAGKYAITAIARWVGSNNSDTTTSNGRGKGAIISLNTSSTDNTVEAVELYCGVDCDGYKAGDTLTVSADQLRGSTKDLVFVLSADDIDYATHCQSCSGRYPEGYSVSTSHVPHSSCNSGAQVSCEPLHITHSFVELFINPSGHVGDIYCGVFSASTCLQQRIYKIFVLVKES